MSIFNGAGRYSEQAVRIQGELRARLAVVLIVGGKDGTGFAVQGDLTDILALPDRLRRMAAAIDDRIANAGNTDTTKPFTDAQVSIRADTKVNERGAL